MTDNSTHSILFELQKNLEDLSSAKTQMEEFRSSSLIVVKGIGHVQEKFVKHLTDLEIDYKKRVNKLEASLINFLSDSNEENKNTIQKVASVSEKEIGKGIEQFQKVVNKVESSNDKKTLVITKLLETIEKDYKLKLQQLQDVVTLFLTSHKEENENILLDIVTTTKESINKGVEKFSNVSDKVEKSNDDKILAIKKLLEHYKSVVEVSSTLIDTLTAIDFPSKLDAISTKSQLITESINNAKQALELKLNETHNSIIDKSLSSKEQIIDIINNTRQVLELKSKEAQSSINEKTTIAQEQINQNTDNKFQSLIKQLSSTKDDINEIVSDKFNELAAQSNLRFENLYNSMNENVVQIYLRKDKQDKEIKTLKTILFIICGLITIGTVVTILVLK